MAKKTTPAKKSRWTAPLVTRLLSPRRCCRSPRALAVAVAVVTGRDEEIMLLVTAREAMTTMAWGSSAAIQSHMVWVWYFLLKREGSTEISTSLLWDTIEPSLTPF